jgi:hypothetical protein
MNADGRRVYHLQIAAVSLGYRCKKTVPNADLPPPNEPIVAGRGRAISLWNISPWRACAQPPINAVQHFAVLGARFASRPIGQQRRDNRPLKISQFVSASVHAKSSEDLESQLAGKRNPLYEFVT